jgi:hypothetical protein
VHLETLGLYISSVWAAIVSGSIIYCTCCISSSVEKISKKLPKSREIAIFSTKRFFLKKSLKNRAIFLAIFWEKIGKIEKIGKKSGKIGKIRKNRDF